MPCLGVSEQPYFLGHLREGSGWLKASPTIRKSLASWKFPWLVSLFPRADREVETVGGWHGHQFLAAVFFFFAKVQLLRGHFRDVGRRAYRQVFRKYFAWREITDLGKAGLHLTGATGNDKVAGDDLTTHGPCCFQQLEMLVSLLWM